MVEKPIHLAISSLALLLALACSPTFELSEEDQLARVDDQASADEPFPGEGERLFPDDEIGRQLDAHLLTLALPAELPEEADQRTAESLAILREHPADVVRLLGAAYQNIDRARYFDRWCIAKTLADLWAPEAYPTLATIARSPIPPEEHEDVHHFSTREEEAMIRMRAVDGIAVLAAGGHSDAEQRLHDIAVDPRTENAAIRTRAIKGYLLAGGDYDARVESIRKALPEDAHGVVTLRVTPREEFEARVRDLARVSEEATNEDEAEEGLPDTEAPTIRETMGGEPDARAK